MGSGKTTAGRRLAAALGWEFLDLDRLISEKTGMSIPEIFSKHGEEWFRSLESEILRGIAPSGGAVLATGGGAPCSGDNMDFMLSNGLTVYLKLTPEQLRKRLESARQERPLIKGMKGDELLEFIRSKLGEREKFYSRASITIDGFNTDIPGLTKVIRELFF